MSEPSHPTETQYHASRSAAVWAGIIGAPTLWAIHLQATYTLITYTCRSGNYLPMHLTTAFFFVAALACAWISWRDKSGETREVPADLEPRSHFTSQLGALLSVLFAWEILAQGIVCFFLSACWN